MASSLTPEIQLRLRLKPVKVREGSLKVGELRLRRFQEELLFKLRSRRLIFLKAPTGSGKTIVPLIPLIDYLLHSKEAVEAYGFSDYMQSSAIYPSRELLDDQYRNITRLLKLFAKSRPASNELTRLASKLGVLDLYDASKAVVAVVRLHGESTDALLESAHKAGLRDKTKLDLLHDLYTLCLHQEASERPLFIITLSTVEHLSLIVEGLYGDRGLLGNVIIKIAEIAKDAVQHGENGLKNLFDEIFSQGYKEIAGLGIPRHRLAAALQRLRFIIYSGLVFVDEAHLYNGITLPTLVSLLVLNLAVSGPSSRLVISSATLPGGIVESLENAARILVREEPETVVEDGSAGEVVVRKETEVVILGYKPRRPSNVVIQNLIAQARLPDALLLREISSDLKKALGQGVNVMIIGDRLYYLRRVAKEVFERLKVKPQCIDSLTRAGLGEEYCSEPHAERRGILVGSSAISYGVDIPSVDLAIVYAKTPSDLIQRIGRTGRRASEGWSTAKVYWVTGYKTAEVIGRNSRHRELDYAEFEKIVSSAVKSPPQGTPGTSRIWAAKSVVALAASVFALLSAFREDARASTVLKDILDRLPAVFESLLKASGMADSSAGLLRLIAGLERVNPELAVVFALPRPMASIIVNGYNAPLQQLLRLYPLCSPEVDPGKYEFYMTVGWEVYNLLASSFNGRVTSLQGLIEAIIKFHAMTGGTGAPQLVQYSPEEGAVTCPLTGLARGGGLRLENRPAVFVDMDWVDADSRAAFVLMNYYSSPSIPVIVRGQYYTGMGLIEAVEEAERVGLVVLP